MALVGLLARKWTYCNLCGSSIDPGFWFLWDSKEQQGYHYRCGQGILADEKRYAQNQKNARSEAATVKDIP